MQLCVSVELCGHVLTVCRVVCVLTVYRMLWVLTVACRTLIVGSVKNWVHSQHMGSDGFFLCVVSYFQSSRTFVFYFTLHPSTQMPILSADFVTRCCAVIDQDIHYNKDNKDRSKAFCEISTSLPFDVFATLECLMDVLTQVCELKVGYLFRKFISEIYLFCF